MRELNWALLPGGELFAAAAAPADPHGNFEERGPRQLQRVQQRVPYKNHSFRDLWAWIPSCCFWRAVLQSKGSGPVLQSKGSGPVLQSKGVYRC